MMGREGMRQQAVGYVAECEGRKWLAFDERLDYLAASSFRLFSEAVSDLELKAAHEANINDKTTELRHDVFKTSQSASGNGSVHRPAMP